MTPTALSEEAQAPGVPTMEGTTGLSMWLGVLRGPLVIAVLFAIVLAAGSSFDVYVAGSIAIYGLASAGQGWLMGRAGQVSLGGGALFAVGAFAAAFTTQVHSLAAFPLPLIAAGLAGAATGAVVAAAPLPALDDVASGPLRGVRVIDMSRAAAGPICGRVLADLGAEVVRVENPDGEASRAVGLTFAANNRNKLSLGLDLTRPQGLDVLARLTEQSDVVLTNALPEASARLGIDYATVAARNPSACHISILGFGHRPPFGGRRVVDAAAQALSGQALAEGGGREPVGCTGGFLDNGTGWLAALGCVATLYQRQTAGHAGSVQAYLLNTSAFVQLFGLTDPPSPGGRLDEDRWGYAADQRLYQTRDGWIAVAATSPAARQAFAEALALAGCALPTPGADREVHGLTATAFAQALGELDLDGQRDALVASGAMRSEPGQSTLQASSV